MSEWSLSSILQNVSGIFTWEPHWSNLIEETTNDSGRARSVINNLKASVNKRGQSRHKNLITKDAQQNMTNRLWEPAEAWKDVYIYNLPEPSWWKNRATQYLLLMSLLCWPQRFFKFTVTENWWHISRSLLRQVVIVAYVIKRLNLYAFNFKARKMAKKPY